MISTKMSFISFGQTFLILTFLMILSGFRIFRPNMEKWQTQSILLLSVTQYSLISSFNFLNIASQRNIAQIGLVVFNISMLGYVAMSIILNYQYLRRNLETIRQMQQFSPSRALDQAAAAWNRSLAIVCSSGCIIIFYYTYEIIFHLVIDMYIIPMDERSSMTSEMLSILHEACDALVIIFLIAIIDKKLLFEKAVAYRVIFPCRSSLYEGYQEEELVELYQLNLQLSEMRDIVTFNEVTISLKDDKAHQRSKEEAIVAEDIIVVVPPTDEENLPMSDILIATLNTEEPTAPPLPAELPPESELNNTIASEDCVFLDSEAD